MPNGFIVVVSAIFLISSLYRLVHKNKRGWGGDYPKVDKFLTYGLIIATSFIIFSALIKITLAVISD